MKNSLFRYVCLVVALLICSFADAQQKANYKLAEKFRLLEQNPIIKYSTEVKPTFINGTDCFYYSFTTREGKKYYYVNPKKKEKRLLFDTAELLSKIAVYTKKAYSSADPYLSFLQIVFIFFMPARIICILLGIKRKGKIPFLYN